MRDMLSGKWIWVWNSRRCLEGNAAAVARRPHDAGEAIMEVDATPTQVDEALLASPLAPPRRARRW